MPTIGTVRTEPINDMAPNDDVRPTDPQLVARLADEGAFALERMRPDKTGRFLLPARSASDPLLANLGPVSGLRGIDAPGSASFDPATCGASSTTTRIFEGFGRPAWLLAPVDAAGR
ncbi:hypothetical protein [uncultured Phenylobacterium sp.]|uniref:hypothetical protein n=1 Tax=uncultured Phenylobacterium sp. TaxID=349273 RepID=UPI0025D4AE7E|nr:hypothetical protein [uncultured Phenylobacterium sp.]